MTPTEFIVWVTATITCLVAYIGVSLLTKRCPTRGQTILMAIGAFCPLVNMLFGALWLVFFVGELISTNADWFNKPICSKKNKER